MDLTEYTDLLQKFVSFKSISTDPTYQTDIRATANWLSKILTGYGFNSKIIEGKSSNPYVTAELIQDGTAETVLIYGHYDVQPATQTDGWMNEPFILTTKNDRLWGRGTVDNKGQLLIHLVTVGLLAKQGKLKCNVKFIIEGNEETGNTEMREVLVKNKDLLKADFMLISDGETSQGRPTIDASFRGGANLTLKIRTAKNDLHSGIYGGAVPNAAMELASLINRFYDEKNRVSFGDFYQGVIEPTHQEFQNNKAIGINFKEMQAITGVRTFITEPGVDFNTQTGLRPMMTVTGMKSGYIGPGYNNIIPAEAEARINFRFVSGQDPERILKAFENFVSREVPGYAEYEIKHDSAWKAIKVDTNSPRMQYIAGLLEKAYGEKPVYKYVGGSAPVVLDYKEVFGAEVVSVSMGNEDCNMHGVNENFDLKLIEKGMAFSRLLFEKK